MSAYAGIWGALFTNKRPLSKAGCLGNAIGMQHLVAFVGSRKNNYVYSIWNGSKATVLLFEFCPHLPWWNGSNLRQRWWDRGVRRFMRGVHRQMGDVWLPDRAMSQNIPNTMTQVNNPNPKWMYRRFNQGTKWSIQCSIHWSIHSILRIYLTNITTYNTMSWNYKVLTPEEFTEHFPTKAEEVPPVVGLPTFVSSNVVRQNSHR